MTFRIALRAEDVLLGRGARLANICLVIALLSFLLPHGIGVSHPFGLPSVDLVRTSLIVFHLLAGVVLVRRWRHTRPVRGVFAAPQTQAVLVAVACWQLFGSVTGYWTFAWAVAYWTSIWGLAFLVSALPSTRGDWSKLARGVSVLFVTLAVWAWAEWITQERLVTWRNTWPTEVLQNSLELRRLYRTSIGPFPTTHYLGLVLLASSGFMLLGRYSLQASVLLAGGLMSTGFVAGYIGGTISLALVALARRTRASLAMLAVFTVLVGGLLLAGGVTAPLMAVAPGTPNSYAHILADTHNGSLNARSHNTMDVMAQVLTTAPLFGFGAGAVVDVPRVRSHTKLSVATDMGGWFVLVVDSGYPPVILLLWLLGRMAWRGWKSGDALCRGGSVSIAGFSVAILSSPVLHALPIVLLSCALIESRLTHLTPIASDGSRHSLPPN